jgi:hypothetical protein
MTFISIYFFSSSSSFFSTPSVTPPSPQKFDLFVIKGRIVTLERPLKDESQRKWTPWTLVVLRGHTPQGVKVKVTSDQNIFKNIFKNISETISENISENIFENLFEYIFKYILKYILDNNFEYIFENIF